MPRANPEDLSKADSTVKYDAEIAAPATDKTTKKVKKESLFINDLGEINIIC